MPEAAAEWVVAWLIPNASHMVHYTPISAAGWRTGMVINTATNLAMAAVCLTAIAIGPRAHAQAPRHTVTVKHAPIANPGDVSDSRSAQQNVAESEQYERLLRRNPAFPESADAKGVRRYHRSRIASKLPREFRSALS